MRIILNNNKYQKKKFLKGYKLQKQTTLTNSHRKKLITFNRS